MNEVEITTKIIGENINIPTSTPSNKNPFLRKGHLQNSWYSTSQTDVELEDDEMRSPVEKATTFDDRAPTSISDNLG
jgi:hypothetical protein